MSPSRIEAEGELDGRRDGGDDADRDGGRDADGHAGRDAEREGGRKAEKIREDRIETPRTARVAWMGGDQATVREVWFLLHGYAQSAPGFLRGFSAVCAPGRLLVAPEGLSRFYRRSKDDSDGPNPGVGASWMTRVERDAEIRDYVRYLDRVARAYPGATARVQSAPRPTRLLLGFSQGAATAARWAALGRVRVHHLVLWGASLPPDLPPRAAGRLRGLELTLVRGDRDEMRREKEERREEGWLDETGVPYRVHTHPGGHEIVPGVLQTLAEAFT